MHGKEKVSWSTLNEHIFRNNVPAEELRFLQTRGINLNGAGFENRLIFHILTAEGDLMEVFKVESEPKNENFTEYKFRSKNGNLGQ